MIPSYLRTRRLGVEVLSLAVLAEAIVVAIQLRSPRLIETTGVSRLGLGVRIVSDQAGLVVLLIGGVSLLAQSGGGLYWIVPGMVAAMISAIVGAWVLLVEIMR